MGRAQQAEIIGFGAAAERERKDVIDLEEPPGAATAPAGPVHIAAATPIALPDVRLTAIGMARLRTWDCGGAA